MTAQGEISARAIVSGPPNRIRPVVALRAMMRLARDSEDTRQFFIALAALRGNSGKRYLKRFAKSPVGKAVLSDRRRLMDTLDDQVRLASLPDGSLGRAYLAFMQGENLSAAGLMQASDDDDLGLGPDGRVLRDRDRDFHDLIHVLTGYGRDMLGEVCIQAFMSRQTGNPAGLVLTISCVLGFLSSAGNRKPAGADLVAKGLVKQAGKALVEAFVNGRKGTWLPGLDWESLLEEDLEDLRCRLRLPAPRIYRALKP